MKVDLYILCVQCETENQPPVEMVTVDSIDDNVEVVQCPECKIKVALRADPRAESSTSSFGLVDV